MVEVKEKTKVKTGTVVKIDLDDTGAIRVTTGNMTQIDIDDEDEDDYDVLPTYQPTEIVYDGKKYIFREPLACECEFTPDGGDDTYFIRYKPFGIYGAQVKHGNRLSISSTSSSPAHTTGLMNWVMKKSGMSIEGCYS
jgi:hypothetical protein